MSIIFLVWDFFCFFFFKQKTAYEMRISDWSSDVCSSDLRRYAVGQQLSGDIAVRMRTQPDEPVALSLAGVRGLGEAAVLLSLKDNSEESKLKRQVAQATKRSEEHTSELQSLMRRSYAVFCSKKKKTTHTTTPQDSIQ